jgi:hypothetical protein
VQRVVTQIRIFLRKRRNARLLREAKSMTIDERYARRQRLRGEAGIAHAAESQATTEKQASVPRDGVDQAARDVETVRRATGDFAIDRQFATYLTPLLVLEDGNAAVREVWEAVDRSGHRFATLTLIQKLVDERLSASS